MYPSENEARPRSRPVRVPNEKIIEMVDGFYDRVKAHPSLGPIFHNAIGEHWDKHLPKMYQFWSSVLNTSGVYSGNPMKVHIQLAEKIAPENFGQWLTLFQETLHELFSAEDAEFIYGKAENIAKSFSLSMFYNPANIHQLQNKS